METVQGHLERKQEVNMLRYWSKNHLDKEQRRKVCTSFFRPFFICTYNDVIPDLKMYLYSQQLEQASADVEKVLTSYEKTGKVPSTVMEAR